MLISTVGWTLEAGVLHSSSISSCSNSSSVTVAVVLTKGGSSSSGSGRNYNTRQFDRELDAGGI